MQALFSKIGRNKKRALSFENNADLPKEPKQDLLKNFRKIL